ncbi:hypothetical protein [Methylobacterium sp. E-045]|uniref:hypothetical protein n=1 Tax=Methylobacterium sp. E-045 TaxID=2836575 RepID=UPI001FB900CB|nr:hypothetical protein [Methylobacterium sp. E-045]MCJ2128350.1 hypothetical protein [Methylobacterium sp. E-045]
MSAVTDLLARAPFAIRHGTQAIVVDRHDESAFVVCEPINDPRARIRDAEAWCTLANAIADQTRLPCRPLSQAIEAPLDPQHLDAVAESSAAFRRQTERSGPHADAAE